jgi:hypothetical protein
MQDTQISTPTALQFLMAQRWTQDDASTMPAQIERPKLQTIPELERAKRLVSMALQLLEEIEASFHLEFVATGGAFAQLDEIKESEIYELLDNIKKLTDIDGERIYNRLFSLIKSAEEEYPEEELVSVSSLRGFEKFLKSGYQWIYPDIAVSPSGNILIEWFKDNEHHVSIEFLGQATAKLVMIVPDITLKSTVIPVITKPRVESIAEVVKPYDVLSWITHSER